jgi:hypothetical protein
MKDYFENLQNAFKKVTRKMMLSIRTSLIYAAILMFGFSSASYADKNRMEAIQCASLYFLATGAFPDSEEMQRALMAGQYFFEMLHSTNSAEKQLKNGEISDLKSITSDHLAELYKLQPKLVVAMYLKCDSWFIDNVQKMVTASENSSDWLECNDPALFAHSSR